MSAYSERYAHRNLIKSIVVSAVIMTIMVLATGTLGWIAWSFAAAYPSVVVRIIAVLVFLLFVVATALAGVYLYMRVKSRGEAHRIASESVSARRSTYRELPSRP